MLLRKFDAAEADEERAEPHMLLVDFGLAEIFESGEAKKDKQVKGSPAYLAPEGFDGRLSLAGAEGPSPSSSPSPTSHGIGVCRTDSEQVATARWVAA